jgi:alkaline phosphatase D
MADMDVRSRLRRREFVIAGTGAGLALAGPGPLNYVALAKERKLPVARAGKFAHGVASGFPGTNAITVWTRVSELTRASRLTLEVARDKHFRHVVKRQSVIADPKHDYTVHARVAGLKPAHEYFYRFETKTKHSRVGTFRTLPPANSNQAIKIGFYSCQSYEAGYYTAQGALAKEKDLDFVLQLGDYIYADVAFPSPFGVRKDPNQVATSLAQFRDKYALYRSDKSLQAAQAAAPWINLWDDHEVQNNYAGGDPAGGETTSAFDPARKVNGYKAFFEQQPTYSYGAGTRVYHKAGFGGLVDLFVLDERQYRSRQPCGQDDIPSCPDASNPDLQFLGAAQETFVQGGLKASKARWKVIANEVQITRRLEADGSSGVDDRDAWGGYLAERQALLGVAKDVPGTVFCTGDIHEFIAGTARLADGTPAAAEICGSSVTSLSGTEANALQGKAGWGTLARPTEPADYHAARLAHNPEWAYLDADHHGYVVCDVSADTFTATMKKLATIKAKSTAQAAPTVVTVRHGSPAVSVA